MNFKELFHSFIRGRHIKFTTTGSKLAYYAGSLRARHAIYEEDYVTSSKKVCVGARSWKAQTLTNRFCCHFSVAKRLNTCTGKTGRARCDGWTHLHSPVLARHVFSSLPRTLMSYSIRIKKSYDCERALIFSSELLIALPLMCLTVLFVKRANYTRHSLTCFIL